MEQGNDYKIAFDWPKLILFVGGIVIVVFALLWIGSLDSGKVNVETSLDNTKVEEKAENLKIEDIKVGTGAEAASGKKVTVNYLGTLTDGKKFDSSYDRNTPYSFILGSGEVIEGWDQGVLGMKVGGKRKLTIPPSLGYGAAGAGDSIPPNSTLIFEIELLKVE